MNGPTSEVLRIGTGAGFSADRLDAARDLVAYGELDYIVFECLGERTLAFGHRARMRDPASGYNKYLGARFYGVLPLCRRHGTRLITNMGAANPRAAAAKALKVARELELFGLKIAWIEGDDIGNLISPDLEIPELGCSIRGVGRSFVGANAYLGADAVLKALATGADVVIGGRIADPSLFLAPMMHHFGWAEEDWPLLGAGTVVGHLMECGAQVTGGYFADPGVKEVPDPAYVGLPIAEVEADGAAVITKLPQAGGLVTAATVSEQLFYEVHDPAAYKTPDVIADFTHVHIEDLGADRVRVIGGAGRERPDSLKVTLAFDGGFLAEAGISYAGPGAGARARLAGEIVQERLTRLHGRNEPLRVDMIGVDSLHRTANPRDPGAAEDVRVRFAMRVDSEEVAELMLWEVESLLCAGPAGGGGYRGRTTASVMTHSAFVDRGRVWPRVEVLTA